MADRRSEKARREFLSEAQETIDALGNELLRLERARHGEEPDPQVLNSVFRGAHSLKGVSSLFGVERMARLAHALEDLLDEVRMGRRPLDGGTLDLLLEAPDLFARIIAEEASGDAPATADEAERLARRLRDPAPRAEPPATSAPAALDLGPEIVGVLTEYEEHRLRSNVARGMAIHRVRVSFDLDSFDRGLAELNAALRTVGELISTLPSPDPADAGGIAFELLVGSKEPAERVRAAAGARATVIPATRVADATAGPPPAATAAAADAPTTAPAGSAPPSGLARRPSPAPARASDPGSIRSVSQAVRVDIRKLDRLMSTVGELVLAKTSLLRIAERLRAGESGGALALDLHRDGRALERKLNELQAGILEVRMVPLSQVFDKLARLVRKASREMGKEVELEVSGGEVELDKLIVEELSDPLMHLVRNALDHAIEAPDDRERVGKRRAGRIGLSAAQRGNHVQIAVEDDGAGIDEERVREVAVERGLAPAAAVRELSRREAMNLIFVPGFSTARAVTDLSGRGVGLDVVKNNIARLSGTIELRTERGRGTRFEMTLPVTLAISRALLVSVAGRTYAVPLTGVLEILALEPSEIRTVETREVLTLRGATLPLVRLSRLFRLGPDASPSALAWPPGRLFVVVVGLAQERIGLAVDDVVGQQDVVVKPLGPALDAVRGIAGATDLGNRRTVLVLDVGGIIDEVLSGEGLRDAVG